MAATYSPLVNSLTKDYVLANGNISNSLSTETMMYMRLAIPRLGWMGSEDPTFGSNFHRYTNLRMPVNVQMIEKDMFSALEPMVALGQITNLRVVFKGISSTGAWLYDISAQDAQSNPIQFPFPYYKVR